MLGIPGDRCQVSRWMCPLALGVHVASQRDTLTTIHDRHRLRSVQAQAQCLSDAHVTKWSVSGVHEQMVALVRRGGLRKYLIAHSRLNLVDFIREQRGPVDATGVKVLQESVPILDDR